MADKFWRQVQKFEDSCWIWQGYLSHGYGVWHPKKNEKHMAHRYAYANIKGSIPEGLELDHLCRNPSCVRPDHLEPVSHTENCFRARRTHCKWGHEFTPENTYQTKLGKMCKACGRDRDKTRPSGWERTRRRVALLA